MRGRSRRRPRRRTPGTHRARPWAASANAGPAAVPRRRRAGRRRRSQVPRPRRRPATSRLREGGHEAVVAARTTRAVKLVVHDFEPDCDAYTEKPGHQLPVDVAFGDVNPEDYDALVIPGGRAPEYIRTDPDVARIVTHFFDRG